MLNMYDLLVKGGEVIDPENGLHGKLDIGVMDGKVAQVSEDIPLSKGKRVLDAGGKIVVPGIIDMHVHTGFVCKGRTAMPMMAKAGTVTAVDCAGPLDEFFDNALNNAAGMNMLCLQMVRPNWNLTGPEVSRKEIEELVENSLEQGALGLKILGGHYPLTPETTRAVMEICNEHKAYVALHVGTTTSKTVDLNSFKEAVELSKGLSVQFAHVNSYCRGQLLGDPVAETMEVLSLLECNPNIFSESYLSSFSGSPGKCLDGELDSLGTANALAMGNYATNEQGLCQAILDGFGSVVCELGDESIRISGREGLDYWKSHHGDMAVTFPIIPASTRFLLATEKDKQGQFIVDAIATDGGGIPRNFIVEKGTALVRLNALTWEDFVTKTSTNPARILGLGNKGHLGVGADADMSILTGTTGRAYGAINRGRIIMLDGAVLGADTTVITTERGLNAVRKLGIEAEAIELNSGRF